MPRDGDHRKAHKRKGRAIRPALQLFADDGAYLMRATPPEISTVSLPVSASMSPLGMVTKQPLGQKSTLSPPPSASSDLLPPSVTISVRGSLSRLTALAA